MSNNAEQQTFRVDGISCANCAKTFENNIKRVKGVKEAKVHFATSKVEVNGHATVADIEKAGSFENIKVVSDDELIERKKKVPFWICYDRIILASLLILFGFVASFLFGENHHYSTIPLAIAILIGGFELFKTGVKNLVRLQFDMKTLMTIAVIGAAIIGEWKEAAIVVILFAISEALERFSMDKARASIRSLMGISPKKATIVRDGVEKRIAIKDIVIGDTMLVKPGESIAMDGIVTNGYSSVNQASITGESIPVEKSVKDNVFAGTVNQDGFLEIKVTKRSEDTTIARIIHLVEEAQAERAPSQSFVDRFAAYYTPLIIIIAALVATIPPALGGDWNTWIYQGLAVLVVGCPCALVISTPVAIVTGIGTAAKNGVLIKGGVYLEKIGELKSIAFDKTGTLTRGTPLVTDVKAFTDDAKHSLSYVAALEHKSQHPLAQAILRYMDQENIDYQHVKVDSFNTLPGKGITGEINGETFYVGSEKLFPKLNEKVRTTIHSYQRDGKTIIICGTDEAVHIVMALRDEPRPESNQIIKELKQLNVKHSIMLTGDHPQTAEALGKELGISTVKAGLLPEDKVQFVKKYKQQYKNIAMVGDGINDTPALAASSVGIAMGSAGTDSALETADVALMGDDLTKLPFTVKLSRKALNIIKQNIAFSIGIKLPALLLVIPGWLTLWIAIIADMGATLLVTLNALRLLRTKK